MGKRILSRRPLDPGGSQFSIRLGRFLAGLAEKLGTFTFNFVLRHWLAIVNLHLLIFLIGALEAPLLLHLDQTWTSRMCYGLYSFFCHQESSRSVFLLGNQLAVCSRCLAFHSSLLAAGLWVSLRIRKPLDLRLALLLVLPSSVDVLLQVLGIRDSTNLIRLTTGALLGMGIALYLFPRAQRALERLGRDRQNILGN